MLLASPEPPISVPRCLCCTPSCSGCVHSSKAVDHFPSSFPLLNNFLIKSCLEVTYRAMQLPRALKGKAPLCKSWVLSTNFHRGRVEFEASWFRLSSAHRSFTLGLSEQEQIVPNRHRLTAPLTPPGARSSLLPPATRTAGLVIALIGLTGLIASVFTLPFPHYITSRA